MKVLILIALAACSSPPRTLEDGKTCYWERSGGGVDSTHGVCYKDGYALQCNYEKERKPPVICASGCVPLEAK